MQEVYWENACHQCRKVVRRHSLQCVSWLDQRCHSCQRHQLSLLHKLDWIRTCAASLGSHHADCCMPAWIIDDDLAQGQRIRLRSGLVLRWDRTKAG